MMSDTPPSSPSGGASAARPPVAPSPAAPGVLSGARRPTSATPSGALYGGLSPLRVQLTAVAATVDDLVETVRDVLVKVEVLSGSQERLATAVHTMETSFTVAFKDVMSALQLMVKAAQGRLSSASGAVEQTLTAVSAAKAAFREDEKKRIISSTRSADVYNSMKRTLQQVIRAVMTVRRVDRGAAKDWLLSTIHLPTGRDSSALSDMRACVPILRTKQHLMQAFKDLVCNGFPVGVGLSRAEQTNDLPACDWTIAPCRPRKLRSLP